MADCCRNCPPAKEQRPIVTSPLRHGIFQGVAGEYLLQCPDLSGDQVSHFVSRTGPSLRILPYRFAVKLLYAEKCTTKEGEVSEDDHATGVALKLIILEYKTI